MIDSIRAQRSWPPSVRHAGRTMLLAAAVCASLLLVPSGAQAVRSSATPLPRQETVTLLSVKWVTAEPVYGSATLAAVADQRPITLTRTTLPVLAEQTDAEGRTWLKVRLPGRVLDRKAPPKTGWITASNTRRSATTWHVVVNVNLRRVTVYRAGRQVRSFAAIVGTAATPTPRGEYFVEETMRLSKNFPGAPYALAASARSAVLQEFMGGPGQIALHGIGNIGGQMGTAASHGCIRVSTTAITWLARNIRAGTPLTIR
jgi:lipoprotein-anchoring transpeptidase ErfK/SrfK